jgi:cyanophycinase-like exopeptidase
MKWFLTQCSGGDVLVLRTSGADGYNNYLYKQLGIHMNSVETIVFNSPEASGDPAILQRIKQAEGIWFAGGDQWDYISYWRNTAVDSLINDAIINRHIVVGGTSAGMAIQGEFYFSARRGTITSTEALSNPYNAKMTIDSAAFLKNRYLQNVITDTHYDDPDRKGRHVAFLARILNDWGIEAKGIASDAYAAICIDSSGLARCYGDYPGSNDYLYFLQTNCESANRGPENCSSGAPLEWDRNSQAIKVYKVNGTASGENTFNLDDWKTGTGGTWENWYVIQGSLFIQQGSQPGCDEPIDVEPLLKPGDITIYPNPVNGGEVHLDFPGVEILRISIIDLNGKIVKVSPVETMEHKIINVSEFPEGFYIINCETRKDTLQYKFIIN